MTHDIFISYAFKDKLIADAICAEMESQGIRCWIAPRDIKPGMKWPNAIVNAIKNCRVVVLVFSANSNISSQVTREVDCAINHEKTIVPFRIENIKPTGSLEYYLGEVHWLDALTSPIESHIDTLSRYVHSILQSTSPESELIEQRKTAEPPKAPAEIKFNTFISSIFRGRRGSPTISDVASLRNRHAMLELVKNIWIKGVLEQSLHKAVVLELGMETHAEAVEHPWQMELRSYGNQNAVLPQGTKIADVFRDASKALLILGEPGSGKTTTLLELAKTMIEQAEQDPFEPIPVVFNLSSWSEKKQPLEKWLIEELNKKYNIPRRIARPWVEEDGLILLLDGLDEVEISTRAECVKAINDFRQEHGLVPIAVCSRVADYEALTSHLILQQAVLLQPLTPEQINQYFAAVGEGLLSLQKMLREDSALQDLAKSPLMLNIMALAYRGLSQDALEKLNTVDERRRHIFATYVNRMLSRAKGAEKYSKEKTLSGLSWLAKNMIQHDQSIFLLEQLQPSWLKSSRHRWIYAFSSRLIAIVLLLVPVVALLLTQGSSWKDCLRVIVIIGIPGLFIALVDGIRLAKRIAHPAPYQKGTVILKSIGNVLGITLLVFTVSSLVISIVDPSSYTYDTILFLATPFGLLFGLRGNWTKQTRDVRTFESFRLSRRFLILFLSIAIFLGGIGFIACISAGNRNINAYGAFPSAQLWNIANGNVITLSEDKKSYVFAGFDPSGQHIYVVDSSYATEVRSADGGLINTISCGNGNLCQLWTINRDGSRFITLDLADSTVRLWSSEGSSLATLGNKYFYPTFSPDGLYIAESGQDGIQIWNADGDPVGKIRVSDQNQYYWLNSKTNSDNWNIAVIERDQNFINVYDKKGNLLNKVAVYRKASDYSYYVTVVVSPDYSHFAVNLSESTVGLYDSSGNLLTVLDNTEPVYSILFSPHNNLIMVVSQTTIRIWDVNESFSVQSLTPIGSIVVYSLPAVEAGTLVATPVPYSEIKTNLFCPDESCIIAHSGNTTRIWDIHGALHAEIDGVDQFVGFTGNSYDSMRIVTLGDNSTTIKLWDVNGSLVKSISGFNEFGDVSSTSLGSTNLSFDALLISSEGNYIVTSQVCEGPSINTWWNTCLQFQIWDTRNGDLLHEKRGLVGRSDSGVARSSPEGDRLITRFTPPSNHMELPIIGIILAALISIPCSLRFRSVETKSSPNKGIRMTGRNALILWVIVGLILMVSAFILFIESFAYIADPSYLAMLIIHLIFSSEGFQAVSDLLIAPTLTCSWISLFAALGFGGLDFISHFVIRYILWRTKTVPWNLVRFLDYATDLILMRKVGGGYIFIHRLLMEYFASLP